MYFRPHAVLRALLYITERCWAGCGCHTFPLAVLGIHVQGQFILYFNQLHPDTNVSHGELCAPWLVCLVSSAWIKGQWIELRDCSQVLQILRVESGGAALCGPGHQLPPLCSHLVSACFSDFQVFSSVVKEIGIFCQECFFLRCLNFLHFRDKLGFMSPVCMHIQYACVECGSPCCSFLGACSKGSCHEYCPQLCQRWDGLETAIITKVNHWHSPVSIYPPHSGFSFKKDPHS